MTRASASAKLNLALVVGPRRADGKHEVVSLLQRIDLCDRISVRRAERLSVAGFADDTLVRSALELLAAAAGVPPGWEVRIDKRIPVAAGLGGGSSDAATALRLANATLGRPLGHETLRELAGRLGADVPFFLANGPQLAEGDGTRLSPVGLPQDFWVLLALPARPVKESTAAVYAAFDARGGDEGFEERRARLHAALAEVRRPRDLAALPENDLASSPLAAQLRAAGAFRADVSGAGPAVYGLFRRRTDAQAAGAVLGRLARVWMTVPAWYG